MYVLDSYLTIQWMRSQRDGTNVWLTTSSESKENIKNGSAGRRLTASSYPLHHEERYTPRSSGGLGQIYSSQLQVYHQVVQASSFSSKSSNDEDYARHHASLGRLTVSRRPQPVHEGLSLGARYLDGW